MSMARSSSTPARDGAETVRKLLEQKFAVCRRFLSITETLVQKIPAQATEEIETLIAWRQDCIDWVEKIDDRLGTLKRGYPRDPRRADADAALEGLTAELSEILQTILHLEGHMTGALAEHLVEMQHQISSMTARKHNFHGYGAGGGRNAGMLNVQT
jgi:hypothetical protein